MSVDLAVASPAFLDLTFVGLEAVPGPGEERFAGDLVRSPGGGAITAIGAARLGLRTALLAPLGDDPAGAFVRSELEREGVELVGPTVTRTPVTVVMPCAGERAMVTYDPGARARAADFDAVAPRAVVAAVDQHDLVPAGARLYVSCGDDDARAFAGGLPQPLSARALFVNRREALVLAGAASADEAARRLADTGAELVVITLGADGAVAMIDGQLAELPGFDAGTPVDTTGAGDLLCAAFAWAELEGAPPEVALRWAVLYATLSVTVPTGAAGAVTRDRLVREASSRGLPPLPALTPSGEETYA